MHKHIIRLLNKVIYDNINIKIKNENLILTIASHFMSLYDIFAIYYLLPNEKFHHQNYHTFVYH